MPPSSLHFDSLEAIVDHVEGMNPSTVSSSGNWSPGELVHHVARTIHVSRTGFGDVRLPLILRLVGPWMKKRVTTKTFKPGFKNPPYLRQLFDPEPGIDFTAAIAILREEVSQSAGGHLTQRSPLLGEMSHEDWVNLHCRHAEMHFSFLQEG